MALTDTAEYWWDVKRRSNVSSNDFYHAKGVECGHSHNESCDTEYLADVTCHAYKRLLKEGFHPQMKEGEAPETYYMTKSAAKKHRKLIAFRNQFGQCSCGSDWIRRTNKTTQQEFLGCGDFPKCKNTKALQVG